MFYYTRRRIMTIIFLLYKKTYNDNRCFYYTIIHIIKCLLSLYKKKYNDNKHFIIQEYV